MVTPLNGACLRRSAGHQQAKQDRAAHNQLRSGKAGERFPDLGSGPGG